VAKTRLAAERLSENRARSGRWRWNAFASRSRTRGHVAGLGGQVLANASFGLGRRHRVQAHDAHLLQARSAGVVSHLEGLDDEPAASPSCRKGACAGMIPSSDLSLAQGGVVTCVVRSVSRNWSAMRWRCKALIASTSCARSRRMACGACTSAR
jgi:hypothetical protein